jgi:predicted dehydrogenase
VSGRDDVRVAVIGLGAMGSSHALWLDRKEIAGARLSAVCDVLPERQLWAAEKLADDVAIYDDVHDVLDPRVCDAVIIATPHYGHCPIGIKAFAAGLHVLVEKPIGVYTREVEELNKAAEAAGTVFGVMYNQRTNPLFQKARELVASGELGELKRTQWTITTWYRPQSYYRTGAWRATWGGEGGGVLMNQAPHQLDLWQWITGQMPARVRAFCRVGRYHDIEVEDDVTAYVEYPNGASGVFITSTGEAPGTDAFELHGDRGKLVIADGRLTLWRNRESERAFNARFTGMFGQPECWRCELPNAGRETGHKGITSNFVAAIRDGTPLIAPGQEGIHGLTLANAMYLSSWTDDWVNLPIDANRYYEELHKRVEESS